MKKFIYSMFALAISAMTFTSCEDVPAPYALPGNEDPVVIEPTGSGTLEDPYNVAAALDYVNGLAADAESPQDVYIKGKVVSVNTNYNESEPQFGNAVFYISDDGTSAKQFYVYRALYLGNKKYTSGTTLAKGDEVIICGKVVNYKGTTPETVQSKAFLYSLNGVTEGGGDGDAGEGKGSGTLNDPFNSVAAANAVKNLTWTSNTEYEKTGEVYVKGKISKIATNGTFTEGGTYGNASFYISEDGSENGEFYCFRVLYLGNKKFESGQTDIKVGDEVIICGKLMNYRGNTPETVAGEAYLYSLNGATDSGSGGGGSGGSGEAKGDGSKANPFNAMAAANAVKDLTWTSNTEYEKTGDVYVKGKISKIANNGTYTGGGTYGNASFYISEDGSQTDEFYCFRILYFDNKKYESGQTDIKVGDEVVVYGKLMNYRGNTPETVAGEAYLISLNGATDGGSGSGGGGSEGGGGSAVTSLTNGNFETWADGLPTGWKSASTASSATLSQSTDAHGGSYSVLVVGDAANNKRLATQEITLAAGDYTFSIWIKATTEDVAQARLGYVPVTGGKVGNYAYAKDYSNLSTSWQQFSYDFTLSAETTVCLLVMNPKASSYSSGKDILVDDATLTKK